jgi:2,5-furandicarboxylate decarboxylase 1
MNIREFIQQSERHLEMIHVDHRMAPDEKMAREISRAGNRPIYFRSRWNGYRVVAGVCAARRHFALALGVSEHDLLPAMLQALKQPLAPPLVESAPCQEIVEEDVNLEALPILTHTRRDGGPYVTAGIAITHDPEGGRNVAFHRLMRLDARRFTARLIENRDTYRIWSRSAGDVPVAICIGAPIQAQLAGAISSSPETDELSIAHALAPLPVVRCLGNALQVPAETEIVLEGRITHQMVDEGPFIDLTGTFDIVRSQPVIEIDRITHRADPIYQALLPGGPEHKMLMGMPREPTIFAAVSDVCECRDVHITPGGASWLHAIVQIEKRAMEDGRRAAEAAFRGHTSLKHVVVVDTDVGIRDSLAVEWAIATRVQADRDLTVWSDQPSSSLDPSATQIPGQKARTAKIGLDATIPWDGPAGPAAPDDFKQVDYFEDDNQ